MIGGFQGEAPSEERFGFCRISETGKRETEQMGRPRMVRHSREHGTARRSGLGGLTLLQQLAGARHRALKLGWGPDHASRPGKEALVKLLIIMR
jgi:hypothetical protein